MDDKTKELYEEENLAQLKGINRSLERKAVLHLTEFPEKIEAVIDENKLAGLLSKLEIDGTPFEKLASDLKEQVELVAKATATALLKNLPPPKDTLTVANIKDARTDEVSVKNLDVLGKQIVSLTEAVMRSRPVINVQKQEIRFPGSPKEALPVRLSDGKSFYNAIVAATSGGGFPDKVIDKSGANWVLRTSATISGADGAIVDGSSSTIKATVLDYANSNPLAVRLTDTNGDYVSAGAGTQYTEDAAAATDPIGSVPMLVRKDTPSATVSNDGDNIAQRGTNYGAAYVTLLDTSGSPVSVGGGTQYDEDTASTAADKLTMAGVVRKDTAASLVDADGDRTQLQVDSSGRLHVNGSGVTQPVSASSLPLPTGASTAARQDTGNTSLATIAGAVAGSEMQVDVLTMPTTTVQATNLDIRDLAKASDSVTAAIENAHEADFDTGAGTDTTPAIGIALPASGGAVVGGTSTNPLRTDPTGSTTQPVSGTVTANLAAGTNNIGDVDILSIAAGDNTIGRVKLTDGTLVASVRDTGTSDSLNVAIVDASGNQITSFGGGTQYTEGDIDATITGTAMLWEDASNTLRAVSAVKPLPIDIAAQTQGDVLVNIQNAALDVQQVGAASNFNVAADTELTTADLDTGAGTDTRAVIGLVGSASGGGQIIPGSATDGLLVNLGSNNDVTVTGTVTANAGTGTFTVGDGGGSLTVDNGGTFAVQAAQSGTWNITNISGTVSLPSGAATLAEQQTQTTALQKLDNIAHSGSDVALSEHVPISGQFDDISTTTVTENQIAPVRITSGRALHVSVRDALPAGTNNIGDVDVLSVPAPLSTTGGGTEATALRVTVASDSTGVLSVDDNGGSLTVDNGGTFAVQATAVGTVADDATTPGSPVMVGGKAVETDGTDPTSVSAEDKVAIFRTDRNRRLLVNPYHPNLWSANEDHTTAQTNNELKAAPGAGLSLYITDIVVSNGATAGSIEFFEDTAGTPAQKVGIIYMAVNGGAVMNFATPIRITPNKNFGFTSTSVTTHGITVNGYTAP